MKKPRRLNSEYAVKQNASGNYHIYAYIHNADMPDGTQKDALAGSVTLDEAAMMELADVVCSETGGCDLYKDLQDDVDNLRDESAALRAHVEQLEGALGAFVDNHDQAVLGKCRDATRTCDTCDLDECPECDCELCQEARLVLAASAHRPEDETAILRQQVDQLRDACRRAEQTVRNLGNAALTGDYATIAANEAANLRADIAATEPEQ